MNGVQRRCGMGKEQVIGNLDGGATASKRFQTRLYRFVGSPLRKSTILLRMVLAIPAALERLVEVRAAAPPLEAVALTQRIMAHMIHHVQEYSTAYNPNSRTFKPTETTVGRYNIRWREFNENFNGCFWPVENGILI